MKELEQGALERANRLVERFGLQVRDENDLRLLVAAVCDVSLEAAARAEISEVSMWLGV